MNRTLTGQNGRKIVMDELLIRSEIYNGNDVDAVFIRMKDRDAYVLNAGVTPGPDFVVCKSKEFAILPTSFYEVRYYDKGHAGDPAREIHAAAGQFNFIRNYGDAIGKQNTLPSAPEVKRARIIRRPRK